MLVTNDLQIPIINSRCAELLDLPPDSSRIRRASTNSLEYQAQPPNPKPAHGHRPVDGAVAGPSRRRRQFAVSERTMPNGSVIEVRSGHLPDGSFVQTFTDITKRREAEAHVARLASEDPLTGLPNRRVFRATLDDLCRRHRHTRSGARPDRLRRPVPRSRPLQGHQRHARAPRRRHAAAGGGEAAEDGRCRTSDILARLGGDEFAIVVPAIDVAWPSSKRWRKRIVEAVVQPYEIDGYQIRSSVSIGIAVGPRDGDDVDDLLMAADLALYAVKARRPRHLQVLQPRDEHGAQRPARARNGPARRDRAQRTRTALSADHRPAAATSSPASRRWRAGAIRSRAWCRRRSSFRWRRTAA